MAEPKRLTRSETERMIGGVCGGLAEFFDVDVTIVRIVFVVLALFGGGGFLLYLVLWAIIPRVSRTDAEPREIVKDSIEEGRELLQEGVEAAKRTYERLRGEQASEQADAGPAADDAAEERNGI